MYEYYVKLAIKTPWFSSNNLNQGCYGALILQVNVIYIYEVGNQCISSFNNRLLYYYYYLELIHFLGVTCSKLKIKLLQFFLGVWDSNFVF
jgi:hypothetical protein